ncbi:tetratricopeptide repeat protein [Stackebrandtia soli]|uniref:tetratricopeptide repeat protein n=1 Tax=Stackebrandtia soli TaxID=1892856 RepID=UPI0039EC4992
MNTHDPNQAPQRLLAGAVDLSSLAQTATSAPSQRQEAPTEPAAAGPGVAVIDVSDATVESEVLQRSLSNPVVVIFWAAQMPESVQSVDLFAKLATESGGTWTLARADVAQNQEFAMGLQLRSVPTVVALWQGRIVDVQEGIVPEQLARQWIGQVVSLAGGEPPAIPVDPQLEAAEEAMSNGEYDVAEAAFSQYLNENPGSVDAEAGLAQVRLLRRVTEADADAAMARATADPKDLDAGMLAADIEVISGNAEAAYSRLITLVQFSAGDDRDRVRKHLLDLFLVASPEDPTVAAARRKLASVLF